MPGIHVLIAKNSEDVEGRNTSLQPRLRDRDPDPAIARTLVKVKFRSHAKAWFAIRPYDNCPPNRGGRVEDSIARYEPC